MLGRQVAAVLQNAHHVKPVTFSIPIRSSVRVAPVAHRRFYATPGRPKGAVGETSRPIKRTSNKTSTTSAEGAATKAEKERAAKKAKADKLKAAQKAKADKAKAAQKAKADKAKAAAKAKADKAKAAGKLKAKKVKKPLTPEQEAIKAQKASQLQLKELQKAALNPPHVVRATAYTMLVKEQLQKSAGPPSQSFAEAQEKLASRIKTTAAQYKSLSPKELEHYNHLAHTAKDASLAAYKAWVNKHTAEEIAMANKARASLRRRLKAQKKSTFKWQEIHDERSVKRPISAFVHFTTNRLASGDFKGIVVPERFKLIGQEWKSLSENEKKKYQSAEAQESKRYISEYNDVYGHAPPVQQQAAAAA